MIDQRLVDYISKYLSSGYNSQQVAESLINAGWPRDQVIEAVNYVNSQHTPSVSLPRKGWE